MGGNSYTEASLNTVRRLSIVIIPVVVLYVGLVVFGVIPSMHYSGPLLGLGISLAWLLVSIFYYFRPVKTLSDQALRFAVFHAFALALFVLVIGFAQPFALLFVLLFLASHQFFGRIGFILSTGSFLAAALVDILSKYPSHPEVLYQTGMTAFTVVFLGGAILSVYRAQETKRQELMHSQERERLQYDRLLTIMNNLTDAAFSTNEKGEVLLYNAASLDLLDTNDNIKGKTISSLLHLHDTEGNAVDIVEVLKETTRVLRRDDLSHSYSDGESVRLELSLAPIRSNYSTRAKREEQGGYIIIARDITKQKSLEEERDEFISVVSHELRTPITIVEGSLSNLDILLHRPQAPSESVLKETVTTAHDQVLYLAKMVNDLSTLSRAERGVADTPEEINVSELLHEMHTQYQHDAEAKKLHLNLDIGGRLGVVNVSRLYLEELLQNFITNAIKYTKEGSVTITAHRAKGHVTFEVKDTGIGISRSDQAKVFNKFYRSEDYRIRETGGTGLGLYVSSKLARKLHTTIQLKSRLNHGSSFSFVLPVE
jgi:PAS domain S-box-containing protein